MRRLQKFGESDFPIHLVSFDSTHFDSAEYLRLGIQFPEEIARSVDKRRAEYFFGRLVASLALQEVGLGHHQVSRGQMRQPVFPPHVVGSISHTNNTAGAVVASADRLNGIGMDIESILAIDSLPSFEKIIASSAEIALMRANLVLPLQVLKTLVFSAKESFYKATSDIAGRVLDYKAIRLVAIDGARRRLQFSVTETLANAWPAGRTCEINYSFLDDRSVLTAFAW